jgi:3',5'-cyclic AMP phosphodiesterase CpdA
VVGDTGGIVNPAPQESVAKAMVAELDGRYPPRFMYHLGDVVYFYGEESNYYPQFFEPYAEYAAPIFAIPGNHDGDVTPKSDATSLEAFVTHFCAPAPRLTRTAAEVKRAAMDQPNVYWTLLHDWVTIVGLYTNVPEGGRIADDQLRWLTEELGAAPQGVPLLLALHHPPYSADSVHGSNIALGELLDQAFTQAGRAPDAVLTGHVHNYQRFGRNYDGREIPYVVAGAGGYHNLHHVAKGLPKLPAQFQDLPDVTMYTYQQDNFGFLTATARGGKVEFAYNIVGANGKTSRFDSFAISAAA